MNKIKDLFRPSLYKVIIFIFVAGLILYYYPEYLETGSILHIAIYLPVYMYLFPKITPIFLLHHGTLIAPITGIFDISLFFFSMLCNFFYWYFLVCIVVAVVDSFLNKSEGNQIV